MGALRLYLALCVVAAHSAGLPFAVHSGTEAVQIFFLISGFNMSLVRDRYPSARRFWRSRFLRIYLPAWTVLAATVLTCLVTGLWKGRWVALQAWPGALRVHGLAGVVYALVANIALVGQDWAMFLGAAPATGLRFASDFWQDPHPLWRLLVLPQMWSVGLEVSFYLLVPLLWRRSTRSLILLAAGTTLLRVAGYAFLGLGRDPWDNRFFPFELGLFVLGMVLQRRGSRLELPLPGRFAPRTAVLVACYLALAQVQTFVDARLGAHWAALVFLPLWAAALPSLFDATRNCPTDRLLGDLSYPVYLVHLAGIYLAAWTSKGAWQTPLAMVFAIGLAELLRRWVEKPVDRLRHRFPAPDQL